MSEHPDSPTCAFHPDRPTMLSCTRCDRPACPDCLTPAAVGMHCTACVAEQRRASPNLAPELLANHRRARRPGWLFWTMIAGFLVLCALLATRDILSYPEIAAPTRFLAFLVVILGWLISLALHEWAHAYVAYRSGDHSVVGRGYLTLDIRKYTDMLMSVILPVVFLLIGGIPLPGGAVWINYGNIRSRHRQALVSAAGPAVNILFAIACLALVKSGMFDSALALKFSLVYLGWLEFLTAILNLLPIPGLDGFGIIRPYLPYGVQAAAMQFASYAIILLFLILWTNRGAAAFLFDLADSGVAAMGIETLFVDVGHFISDIRQLTGGG